MLVERSTRTLHSPFPRSLFKPRRNLSTEVQKIRGIALQTQYHAGPLRLIAGSLFGLAAVDCSGVTVMVVKDSGQWVVGVLVMADGGRWKVGGRIGGNSGRWAVAVLVLVDGG